MTDSSWGRTRLVAWSIIGRQAEQRIRGVSRSHQHILSNLKFDGTGTCKAASCCPASMVDWSNPAAVYRAKRSMAALAALFAGLANSVYPSQNCRIAGFSVSSGT